MHFEMLIENFVEANYSINFNMYNTLNFRMLVILKKRIIIIKSLLILDIHSKKLINNILLLGQNHYI